jgi:hypothetical protein
MECSLLRAAVVTLIVCIAPFVVPAAANAQESRDQLIEAVWKPQRFAFVYRSFSRFYSCGGLEYKLSRILRAVGADESLTLHASGCNAQVQLTKVEIALRVPVEATEENLRELADSTRLLIARMRGETFVTPKDSPRFAAQWRMIDFRRDRELDLDPGDCELVYQLRRDVLPHLSVRIVEDGLTCSAFDNVSRPRLKVEALVQAGPDSARH